MSKRVRVRGVTLHGIASRWIGVATATLMLTTGLGIATTPVYAQGTAEDYRRADQVGQRFNAVAPHLRIEPRWSDDSSRAWYRLDNPDGTREFVLVETAQGIRRPAFDHERLAHALQDATAATPGAANAKPAQPIDPRRLPIERWSVDANDLVRFDALGASWVWNPQDEPPLSRSAANPNPESTNPASETGRNGEGRGSRSQRAHRSNRSPNGLKRVEIRNFNLVLIAQHRSDDAEHDDDDKQLRETEIPLTTDGTPHDGYRGGIFWSPDSRRFVALRTVEGDSRRVTLVRSSPEDQLQPKVETYDYLKPGDRVPQTRPRLFDAENGREIPVSTELFDNPWSIDQFLWTGDSSRFRFSYNQRGHQVMRVVEIQAETGATRAIVEETSPTFIDYAHKQFRHDLDDHHELIWMSERDGWNHLYLYDTQTARVKAQITRGPWMIRDVVKVDPVRRLLWLKVLGLHPGQDPYYIHYVRVGFDGTGFMPLTDADGTHEAWFSPDNRFLIVRHSRVDRAPVIELRDGETGRRIVELERGDLTGLETAGWIAPERFVARGRDGVTPIHGVIYRPTTFDPTRAYPVVEQIYAGPHDHHVPKAFAAFHSGQDLAELGFVVVRIDGMGTNWRGKAFHDVCWRNLKDAGLPDRIAWLKEAAARYPQLDLKRVGIYGGSAGGQSALAALLFHGDFYQAAAADCGCHDNRMDKIWWNELWMGWPVGPHYADNSNVTHAHKLQGHLLLTVGEVDRNVDPASTMQVVNALIRADKDFDLIVFPNGGHGVGWSAYGRRRLFDFFVRHLHGVEPRRPTESSVPTAADTVATFAEPPSRERD
ncbi:peptidase S9B dipeptidylpeptidase IV domain protein [Isosphaera pallida ATCC 43644]|uniref:Peptidase S9B dipeptidylpeptidase IV domain protein n=2 Tax=Isosphaera pallida TaxID=128 RepID=E8QZ61_ISOPI|nr:peptidase S9B dipeptidylpeptidase IV domain protein [Isosphaera pallida ATCC 43644]